MARLPKALAGPHVDRVVAVVLVVATVVVDPSIWTKSAAVVFDGLCLVGVCLLVWWQRRFPIAVSFAAGVLLVLPVLNNGGTVVYDSLISVPAAAASFVIALSLGAHAPWVKSLIGLVPLTIGNAVTDPQFNPFLLVVTVGPWLAGQVFASRQRTAEQLERRARELEEERELFAVASVRYERARIARELHDIVAHNMSLMVVQANAGTYLVGTDPVGASEAFGAIGESARQAHEEIDRLALLLQRVDASDALGLSIVDELVQRARRSGLRVDYHVSGDVEHLDADSAEAVHRLVQEALTNAVKHAAGAPISMTLQGDGDAMVVQVRNGAGSAGESDLTRSGGGYGLVGMRERVLQVGGDIEAGPDGAGGWRVIARVPRYVHQAEVNEARR
jgi:signal transduction histidine kinase